MPSPEPVLPRLIVFSDLERAPSELVLRRFTALGEAAAPDRVLFIVRDYGRPVRMRLDLAVRLRAACLTTEQRFGVADRADLARVLGAHALHLPEHGLSESDARTIMGPGVFVTRACHEFSTALESMADGLLVSPIMSERKGRHAWGPAELARLCTALSLRPDAPAVFALGGVETDNAEACLSAGAAGVAVIGAALAADPAPLLRALGILR